MLELRTLQRHGRQLSLCGFKQCLRLGNVQIGGNAAGPAIHGQIE